MTAEQEEIEAFKNFEATCKKMTFEYVNKRTALPEERITTMLQTHNERSRTPILSGANRKDKADERDKSPKIVSQQQNFVKCASTIGGIRKKKSSSITYLGRSVLANRTTTTPDAIKRSFHQVNHTVSGEVSTGTR
jgi:hypothetical protein